MKTLEEICNSKVPPEIEQRLEAARRRTTSEDMIETLNSKFPLGRCAMINDIPVLPVEFLKNFTLTQITMLMSASIFYTIDWEAKEYYAIDMKTGEEYRSEKKGKKKSKK